MSYFHWPYVEAVEVNASLSVLRLKRIRYCRNLVNVLDLPANENFPCTATHNLSARLRGWLQPGSFLTSRSFLDSAPLKVIQPSWVTSTSVTEAPLQSHDVHYRTGNAMEMRKNKTRFPIFSPNIVQCACDCQNEATVIYCAHCPNEDDEGKRLSRHKKCADCTFVSPPDEPVALSSGHILREPVFQLPCMSERGKHDKSKYFIWSCVS